MPQNQCTCMFIAFETVKLRLVTWSFMGRFHQDNAHNVELILPCWFIADSNRNHRDLIENIVKIIPSVRANRDIGGVQAHVAIRVERVLGLFVDNAFVTPIREIGKGRGPADIVV